MKPPRMDKVAKPDHSEIDSPCPDLQQVRVEVAVMQERLREGDAKMTQHSLTLKEVQESQQQIMVLLQSMQKDLGVGKFVANAIWGFIWMILGGAILAMVSAWIDTHKH